MASGFTQICTRTGRIMLSRTDGISTEMAERSGWGGVIPPFPRIFHHDFRERSHEYTAPHCKSQSDRTAKRTCRTSLPQDGVDPDRLRAQILL
jgi:hypothetical protein